MTHPLTPREKVARALSPKCWEFYDRHVDDPRMAAEIKHEVAPSLQAADNILTALASGSGDHAGLERLAEAFGPDEKWTASGNSVALSVDGLYACIAEANPEGAFSDDHAARIAAFIAAANPATVLSLIAEVAALRANEKAALKECAEWAHKAGEAIGKLETSEAAGIVEGWRDRATEAERKLAEAVGLLSRIAFTPEGQSGLSLDECVSAARTFLSKEAERG